MVDIASSITRASAAAAKKSKGSNKDRVEDTGEAQGLAAPIDGEIVETQDVTDPGIAPVDKDAGEELLFEEAVESFDPKGKGSTSKEPDFIEFMKVVPNVANTTTNPKSLLLEQALAAQLSGNADLADTFLKAIAVLNGGPATQSNSVHQVEPTMTDGGLEYADVSTSHDNVGYAPFLDENIKKLRGPLPLTIFNKIWRQNAISYHVEKRPKNNDSSAVLNYKGYPFVPEWHMTHAHWTFNHRDFYRTLANVYNNQKFADKLLLHKKNVDDITDTRCLMVGFRYDMIMRQITFSSRVNINGVLMIPDISRIREDIVESCYNTSRDFHELQWDENYYAPHYGSCHIDLMTGNARLNLQANNFHNNATARSNFDQKQHFNNQMNTQVGMKPGQPSQNVPNDQGGKKRARSGYKGSNWIEGYGERRSSSNPPASNSGSGSGSNNLLNK